MIDTEQLKKYIAGDSSQSEKEEVQLWLEADEKNRKEFRSLRTLYDITVGHLPDPDIHAVSQKKRPKRLILEMLKIAAAILITFSSTYYFLMPAQKEKVDMEQAIMQSLFVPAGQRAELMLADGTKVWLNGLTTFTFPNKFTETSREVFLDGEAYFDVHHDATKMFTVNTEMHDIHVLGTEFNVSAYSIAKQFETSLLRGSVEIVSRTTSETIKLSPGNRVYLKDNHLIADTIRHHDHFLWKKGLVCFNNERVEDILNQLQLYYDVEIINENPTIKNMQYTGKFHTKDGIEHILNVLKIPTGLRYKKDKEKNFIQIY